MLSILDRYFLRELAQTVAATVVVLLVIVAGSAFAKVLQQVANGSFPASVMFQVLGLRTLDGLTNMMPLASFVGVLMGLGRMYRESEMHVLSSSGMGPGGLLRPVLILGAVLVAITALVSLWLGPWAVRTSDALVIEANRSVIAAGLDAGRFTELPGKGGIIFVESLSRDGSKLGRTFVATQSSSKDGTLHAKVVSAASGELYQESNGDGRFIAFKDGWQYDIPLGANNWRQMRYQRNDTSLSSVKGDEDDDPSHSKGSWTLFKSTDPGDRAEFAWRANAPPLTLVLLLLALPLSRQSPREPKYGRLLLAVVAFYLYYTLLALGRAQIGKGHWHGEAPLWILHALVLALAGWMLWRQYAPRQSRQLRAGMPA
ncbi:LPS export ABC transporter permease LptF [Rhodanobacter sp. FW510-R12]|uniref:LPS export ABC transporter permease LptF n=1 Tax=unclassified Rhodanobacter TaxID=2621553 RepID=UPI0007A9B3F0|nr:MULTISPECIES: LPS export ABC transporter permease LptF [unclassified Rhodanobacter]KZC17270.1 LPS export ABC transporter permease LptF [Rhodanobacter sp. FW104-R8]KZC29126.1 LPS export ABC transporter permease LptF [Rhodanobacter sp. FW510-T8]KZC33064.1 LPS export ABC transporter permease LptF [Rhodanobacter sp. FW510-R10]